MLLQGFDDAFIVYVTKADPTYVTILTAEDAAKFKLKFDGELPKADDIASMKEYLPPQVSSRLRQSH
jgi:hypothetical protein